MEIWQKEEHCHRNGPPREHTHDERQRSLWLSCPSCVYLTSALVCLHAEVSQVQRPPFCNLTSPAPMGMGSSQLVTCRRIWRGCEMCLLLAGPFMWSVLLVESASLTQRDKVPLSKVERVKVSHALPWVDLCLQKVGLRRQQWGHDQRGG